jgi:hypothetical protein
MPEYLKFINTVFKKNRFYIFGINIVFLIIAIMLITNQTVFVISQNTSSIKSLAEKIRSLDEKISLQESAVLDIIQFKESFNQSENININTELKLNQLYTKFEQLNMEHKKIQEVVAGSPDTLIDFALLKKEFNNLKNNYNELKKSTSEEINKNFELFKWFIYINFFIALTIAGMVIGIYYQSKHSNKN